MHRAITGLIEAGLTSDRTMRDLSHLLMSDRLPGRQFIWDTNGKKPVEYLLRPDRSRSFSKTADANKNELHWRFKDTGTRALSAKTFERVKAPFKILASLGILLREKQHGHYRYEVNPAWTPLIKAYLEFSKKPARK